MSDDDLARLRAKAAAADLLAPVVVGLIAAGGGLTAVRPAGEGGGEVIGDRFAGVTHAE